MNKKEIASLSLEDLLSAFYKSAVQCTKEENSKRGITKKTAQVDSYLIEEIQKRFDINLEQLKNL